MTHNFSVIMSSKIVLKKEDLGKFTIPYTIVIVKYAKALRDLCARINVMPFPCFASWVCVLLRLPP